jgi:hypothetical protein
VRKSPIKRDDAALDKLIAAAQLQPLLSNAKWVKLLTALVESWPLVQECRVKLIWEDTCGTRRLLLDQHTSYNFDYYASAVEAMITGTPRGWYAYKEIEWLEFPRDTAVGTQDLAAIQRVIEAVGQFRLVLMPDSFQLVAYLRS